tara:strand:- start:82 stop:327 length:246 start_codon:yes stop_codon:yes gene_type:complete
MMDFDLNSTPPHQMQPQKVFLFRGLTKLRFMLNYESILFFPCFSRQMVYTKLHPVSVMSVYGYGAYERFGRFVNPRSPQNQ